MKEKIINCIDFIKGFCCLHLIPSILFGFFTWGMFSLSFPPETMILKRAFDFCLFWFIASICIHTLCFIGYFIVDVTFNKKRENPVTYRLMLENASGDGEELGWKLVLVTFIFACLFLFFKLSSSEQFQTFLHVVEQARKEILQ